MSNQVYIEKNMLLKIIDGNAEYYGGFGENSITASELLRCINLVPIASVCPVVRCGECKHWNAVNEGTAFYSCDMLEIITPAEFYCAHGVQRATQEVKE